MLEGEKWIVVVSSSAMLVVSCLQQRVGALLTQALRIKCD